MRNYVKMEGKWKTLKEMQKIGWKERERNEWNTENWIKRKIILKKEREWKRRSTENRTKRRMREKVKWIKCKKKKKKKTRIKKKRKENKAWNE